MGGRAVRERNGGSAFRRGGKGGGGEVNIISEYLARNNISRRYNPHTSLCLQNQATTTLNMLTKDEAAELFIYNTHGKSVDNWKGFFDQP